MYLANSMGWRIVQFAPSVQRPSPKHVAMCQDVQQAKQNSSKLLYVTMNQTVSTKPKVSNVQSFNPTETAISDSWWHLLAFELQS
jgi:hypothetical protein